ncbi:MAG: SH3 domain-containing protein [Anaerolineae bacterium]|nr:SH3 domain-containing protein [Anaerolineae bacterium]
MLTLIVMLALFALPTAAQDAPNFGTVQTTTALKLRTGPGEEYETVEVLPFGTALILEEPLRDQFWVPVRTPDGSRRGWVSTCCLVFPVPGSVQPSGDGAPRDWTVIARTVTASYLRAEPDENSEDLALLPRGTSLALESGQQGIWVPVRVMDTGQRGWIAEALIEMSVGLPEESVAQAAALSPERIAYGESLMMRLAVVPIVPPTLSGTVRQIFARGQQLGNNPQVVSKAGDCNMASGAFLTLIGRRQYSLGEYGHLQAVIDYFGGSLARDSAAAHAGFVTTSMFDSMVSDPSRCPSNEGPLVCELNRAKPSILFIMFGSGDMHYLSPSQYDAALRSIVETTIDHGVIPVLITTPSNPDKNSMWLKLLELNSAVVDVARAYDVPVVNLWLATQYMPKGGVADDLLHLSYSGVDWMYFNGDQDIWGYTRANLVALQMLDLLYNSLPIP